MIGDLPEPLTPADCDLRDFQYMPLDVLRLRDSDLAARTTGEEFRCAVLLWCAAWHQVPAGSLPDDDVNLAIYAGYGRAVDQWRNVREGSLRGWIKCSDGRLYHPVVAEKANESWHAKHRQAHDKLCERVRKRNKGRIDSGAVPLEVPEFEQWVLMGRPLEKSLFSTEFSTPSAGKRKRVAGKEGCGAGNEQDFRRNDASFPPENALKGREGKGTEGNIKTIGSNDDIAGLTREHVREAPAVVVDDGSMTPAKVAVALIAWERERKKALRGVSASHPTVVEIAEMNVTLDELRRAYDAAVADRQATGDLAPVNAGFVKRFVEIARNPPKARPKRDEWHRTDEGVMRKAREVGLGQGRPGETMNSLRDRVFAKLREIEQQEHAA